MDYRENFSELIAYANKILMPFDGICPAGCCACEQHESMVLIPGEEAFHCYPKETMNCFRTDDNGVIYQEGVDGYCPFYQDKHYSQHCSKYHNRPVDCRIFPLFPIFEIKESSFRIARAGDYCPIHDDIKDPFLKAVTEVCSLLNMSMNNDWKNRYNELNNFHTSDPGSRFITSPIVHTESLCIKFKNIHSSV